MELRRYLFEKRMTQVEFSKLIDYNVQYLRSVMSGRVIAGHKLLRAIEKATNGQVTAKELLDEFRKERENEQVDL